VVAGVAVGVGTGLALPAPQPMLPTEATTSNNASVDSIRRRRDGGQNSSSPARAEPPPLSPHRFRLDSPVTAGEVEAAVVCTVKVVAATAFVATVAVQLHHSKEPRA
jgi:hypothetical protein